MNLSKAALFLTGAFSALSTGLVQATAVADPYTIDMPNSLPFKVKIHRANVCDADVGWGKSDPYVKVVMILNGVQKTCGKTSVKSGTHTPTWNQVIDCGTFTKAEWTKRSGIYMQLQMWDYDYATNDDSLGKATVAKWWKYGERTSGVESIASSYGSDCGTSRVWYSVISPTTTKTNCLQEKPGGEYRLVSETDSYFELQEIYDGYKAKGYALAEPGDMVEVGGVKGKLDDKCNHKQYKEVILCTRCKGDDIGELGVIKVDADQVEVILKSLGHLNVWKPGDKIPYLGGTGTIQHDCSVDPEKASSYGDPHFKKWNGEVFDFHGGCDLVLLQNPHFSNGMGMNIHIRTSIRTWWSYIASAAVQLGENSIQISGSEKGNPTFSINGGDMTELVTQHSSVGDFPVNFRRVNGHQTITRIELGNKDAVSIETYKHFVRVNFKDESHQAFDGSIGLLGSYPDGHMKSRDRKTDIEDADEFGQHWMVRATDPILFSDVEASKIPEQCTMPTVLPQEEARRRLGEASITEEQATLACAHVREAERDGCIFDVMAIQDMDMAGSY